MEREPIDARVHEDPAGLSRLASTLEHYPDEALEEVGFLLAGDRSAEFYRGLLAGLVLLAAWRRLRPRSNRASKEPTGGPG